MSNSVDFKLTQTSTLISAQFSTDKSSKTEDTSSNKISIYAKQDILDISTQVNILNKQSNKNTDYSALEKKLGIDSNKWGVEAVSNDIFSFVKTVYESYKMNHSDEDSKKVLDSFYKLAKDSVTQGYQQARIFLGALPDDVATLAEGTFNKTIEKLDTWYKNGGKDEAASTDNTTDSTQNTAKDSNSSTNSTTSSTESKGLTTDELLQLAEDLKNQVVDLLKQQGFTFNESSTKKSGFDIKA